MPTAVSTSTAPVDSAGATADRLRFGPFTLLPREQRLLRDGIEVPMGARALEVLRVLVERPGRLVTKTELLSAVWRGLVVEESNLHAQVSRIRKAVGADAIATVPGLGYRFVRLVGVEPPATASAVAATPADRTAPDASAGPRPMSVLVMPLVESGAPPEHAYFADAITDDLVAQLSRIRGCTVIASSTSLAFKGEDVDAHEAAQGLGVRHVLQGRLERDARSIELLARLSDASTRQVVWSDRIEVELADVRAIRRELAARLSVALDLQLLHAEARRLAAQPPASPDATDLVMQARAIGGSGWRHDHYLRSLALYDRAIAIDPHHQEAVARRALARVAIAFAWPGPGMAADVALAEADALRALELDSLDPIAHRALSLVRQQQFRLDDALCAVDASLDLDPNAAQSFAQRGEVLKYLGETAPARAALLRALELSPRDPHRWVALNRLGTVELLAGDPERALPWLERSYAVHAYWGTAMSLVAALSALGRMERIPGLLRQRDAEMEEVRRFRRWNRASSHPTYLRQFRVHVAEPLLRCGVYPDVAAIDAWEARQRRGADG
jgi:TolB-like protein/Tfp pilus assembly protein PilF